MQEPARETRLGDHVQASDVKQRLIKHSDSSALLLWPPNLFAFTSYLLHLSGAYQLVVSPPPPERGRPELYHWPPRQPLWELLAEHMETTVGKSDRTLGPVIYAIKEELTFLREGGLARVNSITTDQYNEWTYMVRKAALEWRHQFDRLRSQPSHIWEAYKRLLMDHGAKLEDGSHTITPPPLLRACWEIFRDVYYPGNDGDGAWDIATLLCNSADPQSSGPSRETAWLAAVSLLTMHAIADDASVGWGILADQNMDVDFPTLAEITRLIGVTRSGAGSLGSNRDKLPLGTRPAANEEALPTIRQVVTNSPAQHFAFDHLQEHGTLATIGSRRVRILPKRHNPDVGITLRSLSSNLAFHLSTIDVNWHRDNDSDLATRLSKRHGDGKRPVEHFTMLLLPFPMNIHTKDFNPLPVDQAGAAIDNRKTYGFFKYNPERSRREAVVQEISNAIQRARDEEEKVDIVVLPESALDSGGFDSLSKSLCRPDGDAPNTLRDVSVLIAGVSEHVEGGFDRNAVRCAYRNGGKFKYLEQFKHHRWQLSRSQIEQYGLTRALSVDTKWWEAINVERRHVSFVNIGDGITLCPLICEDLARQDPIADLIRQVGPSLMVTILMDGPQHRDRWSSRYAAILSEDPGSAVLTLTSFGMVRRWSTRFGRMSRVIALWSDKEGTREIELESDAKGVLLTLKVESDCEVIADGRLEMCPTSKVTLMDVIQVQGHSDIRGSS